MSVCRGCGGTGIDLSVSPRRVQFLTRPIIMRRGGQDAGATVRVVISPTLRNVRLHFEGPLSAVADHVEKREAQGYRIDAGEAPERALACEWCNGYGSPEGQLTVHALEKLV